MEHGCPRRASVDTKAVIALTSAAFLKEVFGIIWPGIIHTGINKTRVSMSFPEKHIKQQPCTACGGSGMLRQGSDSYRTCLVCMGVGTIASHDHDHEPVTVPAEILSASSFAAK